MRKQPRNFDEQCVAEMARKDLWATFWWIMTQPRAYQKRYKRAALRAIGLKEKTNG